MGDTHIEGVVTQTAVNGSVTLSGGQGNVFDLTLSGNTTVAFAGLKKGKKYTVIARQPVAGNCEVSVSGASALNGIAQPGGVTSSGFLLSNDLSGSGCTIYEFVALSATTVASTDRPRAKSLRSAITGTFTLTGDFKVTHVVAGAGNVTLEVENLFIGEEYIFIFQQDGVGGRTLTFTPPGWTMRQDPAASLAANAGANAISTYRLIAIDDNELYVSRY